MYLQTNFTKATAFENGQKHEEKKLIILTDIKILSRITIFKGEHFDVKGSQNFTLNHNGDLTVMREIQ